jgi:hypothetical protein
VLDAASGLRVRAEVSDDQGSASEDLVPALAFRGDRGFVFLPLELEGELSGQFTVRSEEPPPPNARVSFTPLPGGELFVDDPLLDGRDRSRADDLQRGAHGRPDGPLLRRRQL